MQIKDNAVERLIHLGAQNFMEFLRAETGVQRNEAACKVRTVIHCLSEITGYNTLSKIDTKQREAWHAEIAGKGKVLFAEQYRKDQEENADI